jgi:hypothetical protein
VSIVVRPLIGESALNVVEWKRLFDPRPAMTHSLKHALEQVEQLPEVEQDAIAAVILEELEDEARWQAAFDGSQEQLAALAREARTEFRAGKTRELDPEQL